MKEGGQPMERENATKKTKIYNVLVVRRLQ